MPLSRTRDYMSIGEVLESLRSDFPDVTISKIRFLESEGLIDPERTSSGYRKFYDGDVTKLRYILELQRDHFMPLRVIRERLAAPEAGGGPAPQIAPTPNEVPAAPLDTSAPDVPDLGSVTLTKEELLSASGLSENDFNGLCDFGLLASDGTYDGDDLIAAKAARGLFKFGVEPRHLRMYRQFADRETAFFEQVVSPVAGRKDPDAQREAARSVRELAALSRQFRDALLRASLRSLS
ncbi:MAG: MerR family transcriptional regulator [Actinomycetota bacterium]|nr:MerR family transcriptional regulator [Actinomycetota bacterium]